MKINLLLPNILIIFLIIHLQLCCRITTLTFYIFNNFKISDFNKEYTSSLRMIGMRSKHIGAFLSVVI